MEQPKPEGKKEYFLDLNTQINSMTVTNPDGGKEIIVKGADGKRKFKLAYDSHGTPTEVVHFTDDDQEQVFTDPNVLAEVDAQVRGLLGEVVEEDNSPHGGAVQ